MEYLTEEGLKRLESRLRYLEEVRRPHVAEQLREVFDGGVKLDDPIVYDQVLQELAQVEAEMERLIAIRRDAKIIRARAVNGTVIPGCVVVVCERHAAEPETYHLVGSVEARPHEGKLSIKSPLGSALLGARVGDEVTVKAPDGDLVFAILAVKSPRSPDGHTSNGKSAAAAD